MSNLSNTRHAFSVLATDLDGTLIPLEGNEDNKSDLFTLHEQLRKNRIQLVFATGRHFESVCRAMEVFQLPSPQWIVCDVGTSIFQRQSSGQFVLVDEYHQHLHEIVSILPISELCQRLEVIDGLRLQEQEKQGRFKLSYYADADGLNELVTRVQSLLDEMNAPYSMIHSVDPFNGDALVDLLPASASKAYALDWWSQHTQTSRDRIVFAGDSGNDTAALATGHAIIVGNACRKLTRQVHEAHRKAGWRNRLFLARSEATSGVLDGCRWFGLAEKNDATIRRLGATPVTRNESHFCVWAPNHKTVIVEAHVDDATMRVELTPEDGGYFRGFASNVGPEAKYRYVLDGSTSRPDPTSRFQPDGVHGASQVVDHQSFPWTDQSWQGITKRDLVIYELHVGAFTEAGTFQAAKQRIPWLRDLGITAIEIMPVAQSPGRWNWGYDGVNLYAVRNTYGRPEDFQDFVNACHESGISIFLDVVYNHLGPEGNYLADFGPYFSNKHHTPWGAAFNYDGRHSPQVRRFIVDNAIHWLDEYHLDGLRLDAVHFMLDDSDEHVLREIRRAVDDFAMTANRHIHLIAEANVFDRELLSHKHETPAYDAIWCDCLMHSIYAHALPDLKLTRREYHGCEDIATALKLGYVYEGPKHTRVMSDDDTSQSDDHIESLVMALQTHDSVGNHPHGKRLHQLVSKEFQKAAAALFLLYPSIPMIFMGEDVAAETPFTFFADFDDRHLRKVVDEGRAKEYPQHAWDEAVLPSDARAFYGAKCQDSKHHDDDVRSWYRNLISLRRQGISEAWLKPQHMELRHDPHHDLFSICYKTANGFQVEVHVRLAPFERSVKSVPVETEGELVLSSIPQLVYDEDRLCILENQAVVIRC